MLSDYTLPLLNGGKPDRAVIFLHGLGDRGDGGLLSIGQMWQRALPSCEFLCPDAPFAYDMAPADFGGRQWFSLQSFSPESIEAGVTIAAPILDEYIDHVLATRNLTADRLALIGFSQGTMMALYVAPRRAGQVACVLGYSGKLAGAEVLAAQKKSTPPVMLIHGTADDVVPYVLMGQAEQGLKEAGIPVTTVTCPSLAHGIDDLGIRKGLDFLLENLA